MASPGKIFESPWPPLSIHQISNHLVFIGGGALDRRRDEKRIILQEDSCKSIQKTVARRQWPVSRRSGRKTVVGVAVEKHWLNKSVGGVALVAK
jgi:hypothetical protein